MTPTQSYRKHYQLLGHIGQTEIRVFGPSNRSKYVYFADSEDEFVETVAELDDGKTNIGVGINERQRDGTHDDEVKTLRYIVLDSDSTEDKDRDTIVNFLKNNGITLSAIVDSGNKGYHYYLPIEPVTDLVEIRQTLDNAKHYFCTTHKLPVDEKCFNPSRIIRIWGTYNPNGRRRATVSWCDLNPPEKPTPPTFFPPAPLYTTNRKIAQSEQQRNQVIASCAFLDAFFKGDIKPQALANKTGTSFNHAFAPNAAAYARQKKLNTDPLYRLAKLKGHGAAEIDAWVKQPGLEFNYAVLRANVKAHYPEHYTQYFVTETLDFTNNLRYSAAGEFKGSPDDYKTTYRRAPWFTISDHWAIRARVISYDNPQELVILGNAYTIIEDEHDEILASDGQVKKHYLYLDEKPFTAKEAQECGLKPTPKAIKCNLYNFTAIDAHNQQWSVLSEQKLESGDYTLYGTRFDIADKLKVGTIANLSSRKRVLLLHSYESEDRTFADLSALYEKMPFSTEEVLEWLLTDTRYDPVPTYDPGPVLSEVYRAWLFSGDDNGRQLNLCVMGAPGSGKTPQLASIAHKFNEEVTGGTTTTLKGLTISFYGTEPRPGAFMKARRCLPIDEFFKILNNRGLDSYEDLTSLNSVMDGAEFVAESGKYTVKMKPTSRMIATTNHIHERFTGSKTIGKRMSFSRMCQVLPSDFMGRIVFFLQTKEEHKSVVEGERISYDNKQYAISSSDWLAMYDFVNSQPVHGIDDRKLRGITHGITMDSEYREAYLKSCSRNARLLMAGVVRTRCLDEKKTSFVAVDKDYVAFARLWKEIHARWYEDAVPGEVYALLTDREKALLETVKTQEGGQWSWYLAQKAGYTNAERERLRGYGLLRYDHESKYLVVSNDSLE